MGKQYNISISAAVMSAIADHTEAISYFTKERPESIDIKWQHNGVIIESRIFFERLLSFETEQEIITYVQNFIAQVNDIHDNLMADTTKKQRFKIGFVEIAVALISAALIAAGIFALN